VRPFQSVAVTGGVGEGKSTILGYLRDLGYRTASSDEAARAVFEDTQVRERLASLAGLAFPLDRDALRQAIASDEGLRREVNRLMHPRVLARLSQASAQFVEVPLLIEACLHPLFKRVWVATCGAAEQRSRLLQRYGDAAHVESILGTQLTSRAKSVFADAVVRTNGPEEAVMHLVSVLAKREWEGHEPAR